MDEKKEEKQETEETKKQEEPAQSEGNTGDGNKPEVYQPIDDANLAAKRLEDANKKKEELLDREESLMAKRRLGGVTEAGQPTKEETEDEKWAKDAKGRYAGTGLDPTTDDTPTEFH